MKPKLVIVATVSMPFATFLRGQPRFLAEHFDVVLVTSPDVLNARIAAHEGVRLVEIPMTRQITPGRDLKSLRDLVAFLRAEQPAIVHTYTPKAGLLGMVAARLAGVRHRFHSVLGLPHTESGGARRALLLTSENTTYRCASRLFSISHQMSAHLPSAYGRRRVEVIGAGSINGLDTAVYSPAAIEDSERTTLRASLDIDDGHLVLLFIGRVVGDKGVTELVDAFTKIAADHPVTLLVVGPEEAELDPLPPRVRELLGTHAQIRRVPWADDVRPYLAIADVMVLPSYREGFGNVLLEAGAMGVPCVTTDIDGPNEIVRHEVNGLLVPPKDTVALESALRRLVENPQLRGQIAARARPAIVTQFDQGEFHESLLAAYRGALASTSA